jgi:hypothetical protein
MLNNKEKYVQFTNICHLLKDLVTLIIKKYIIFFENFNYIRMYLK